MLPPHELYFPDAAVTGEVVAFSEELRRSHAREQRKRKAGVSVRVAGIELDSTPRQCLFPRLCPFRPAEHGGKSDISSDKHRIEIDGARAGEFHQETIAHDLEQPPRMFGDVGLDDIGPQSAKPRQCIGLIGADQA